MRARIIIGISAICFVFLANAASSADEKSKGGQVNVGDAAPDFEATDHLGKRRKLTDFRGKKVILWFYPKANTPG